MNVLLADADIPYDKLKEMDEVNPLFRQTDVAIGIAGLDPLYSYIGQHDPHGHEFRVQEICVADELAAASELVKGNTSRVPVAVVRGYEWERRSDATMAPVIRDAERDLFR